MKKEIVWFIVLSYVLSALIWLLGYFLDSGRTFFMAISTFVPSFVAFYILYRYHKKELKDKLKKIVHLKISFHIFFLIFLIIPLIMVISYILMIILNFETPDFSFKFFEIPIVFVVILLIMGPLGEEFGWRGYLLPKFLKRMDIIKASFLIGIVWSSWHLPLFFIPGALQNELVLIHGLWITLIGYTFYTVLLSILIGIVFQLSHQSVLSAILLHAVANTTIGLLPLVFSQQGAIIFLSTMLIVVYLVIQHNKIQNKPFKKMNPSKEPT